MSGTYLYCQNTSCREYLGSLGGDSCHHCGWVSGEAPECKPTLAAQPYQDHTPHLHVGDSRFESWYSGYNPKAKGDKQRARDAYAAGMGDSLVAAQQPARQPLTDEQITEIWMQPISNGTTGSAWRRAVARAIERAHGITGEQT